VTRTLVIDDEPAICGLLRAILTMNGHEILEAGDGAEALRLLEGQPVDLVFCDLFMPGMDGLETIPRIRREYPAARIVAMSAGGRYGLADLLDVALHLGAAVTLDKPFTADQVLAAVAVALASE
jgi:CheY-like chemotaxis protein